MTRPVTVVCVLNPSAVYTAEYVWALKRAVHRHLPHADFRCVTNVESVSLSRVPLAYPWPRHWCLVNWWQPGLFTGRVLAMGLDTLITGDVSEIAAYDGPMAGISDFYEPRVLASGVMSWHADEGAILYETFTRNADEIMDTYPRMDPWMRTVIPNAVRLTDVFPGQIVSYKKHARHGIPANARIVCLHGRPRLTELPEKSWAYHHWRAA